MAHRFSVQAQQMFMKFFSLSFRVLTIFNKVWLFLMKERGLFHKILPLKGAE